jgi:hypothetical protein
VILSQEFARTGLVSGEYRNLYPAHCLSDPPALLDLEDIPYPSGDIVGLKQAACEVRFVRKVVRRHDLKIVFSCQLRYPRWRSAAALLPGSVDRQPPLRQHSSALSEQAAPALRTQRNAKRGNLARVLIRRVTRVCPRLSQLDFRNAGRGRLREPCGQWLRRR